MKKLYTFTKEIQIEAEDYDDAVDQLADIIGEGTSLEQWDWTSVEITDKELSMYKRENTD